MNKESKLNELLQTKVAVIDFYTERVTDESTVMDVLSGSDVGIKSDDTGFYLYDYHDENDTTFLGETIFDALKQLNTFEYYFMV